MSGTVSRPNRQVCDILRSLSLGPFDYLKWKLLAVRCEAATPVNVTVSVASVLRRAAISTLRKSPAADQRLMSCKIVRKMPAQSPECVFFLPSDLSPRKRAAEPSLITCLPRAKANASAGTSSVITEPAPT